MNKRVSYIIIGLLAIAIGVGYTLAACDVIESFTVFVPGWWTVFIIVPGLVSLFSRGSNKFLSLCAIAVGVALFLHKNDLLGGVRKFVIPVLVIIFGLSLIFSALFGRRKKDKVFFPEVPEDGTIPNFEVSFGELNPDYAGKVFEGCSMDVTFGSGKLDLRDAIINGDVTISVNTAFSGVDIKLPPGCHLNLQTSTSFGGVTNKYESSDDPDAHVVQIFVAVSFGGVEIK